MREPTDYDRASCPICKGARCSDCLWSGLELTREDFLNEDEEVTAKRRSAQADGFPDLQMTEPHSAEDASDDDFGY